MRTKVIVAVILASVCFATWLLIYSRVSPDGFDRAQNTLPPTTKRVLDTGERFVLFSLDPIPPAPLRESDPQPKEMFCGYAVLGKTEIHDQKERAELIQSLYKGISESNGMVALCFNPRHGISATLGGETVDLVICFECFSIESYAKDRRSVRTTRSPQPIFNRALERAGLPIAKDE